MSQPLQQVGDALFTYPTDWKGREIARIDGLGASAFYGHDVWGKYAHALVAFDETLWADCSAGGIRIHTPPAGSYVGDFYRLRRPLTTSEAERLRTWWEDHEGLSYGYGSLVRLAIIYRLCRVLPFVKLRWLTAKGTGWVCSTAASASYEAAERDLQPLLHKSVEGPMLLSLSREWGLVYRGWRMPSVGEVQEDKMLLEVARARRAGGL